MGEERERGEKKRERRMKLQRTGEKDREKKRWKEGERREIERGKGEKDQ